MLSEPTSAVSANHLLVAAKAIGQADDGGSVTALPGELERLSEALRAVGRAYEEAACRVVPGARSTDHGICGRYQRAAARWPTSPPPSHEGFAAALSALHDAAGAVRTAARSCDKARDLVDGLVRDSHALTR
jgi:hypothetical protein